ncbi:MAG: YihY/virulence factor BrkB family protein [Thermomicrobiales bacterium]
MIRASATSLYRTHAVEWAAALAFYGVLSFFPLLIGLAVLSATVVDLEWAVARAGDLLAQVLPEGEREVEGIITDAAENRRRVGVLAVVALLVPGRRVLGAMTTALNLMSETDELEDPVKRRAAVEVVLFGLLALLFIVALLSGPVVEAGLTAAGVAPGPREPAYAVLRLLSTAAVVWGLLFTVYVVVPRGRRRWPAAAAGASVATVLFLVARTGFTIALSVMGETITTIYGPITVAALLLIWGWYASLILLAGGSFAAHVKVLRIEAAERGEAARPDHPASTGVPS